MPAIHSGSVTGTTIRCFDDIATPASQQTLVLVHGVGLNHAVWAPQIEHFRKSCKVIAYDTLGHGESALPPETTGFSPWVDQLLDVLDSVGVEHATIVGHSMGALISIAFALEHPDRTTSIIPIAGVYNRTRQHAERAKATAVSLFKDGPAAHVENALGRWYTPEDQADAVRNHAVRLSRSWLESADPVGYPRAYATFASHSDDFVGRMGDIKCGALFISAEFDPNSTPAMSDAMAAAVPRGRAVMIPDERHMVPLIAPEKVNPLIEQTLIEANQHDRVEI